MPISLGRNNIKPVSPNCKGQYDKEMSSNEDLILETFVFVLLKIREKSGFFFAATIERKESLRKKFIMKRGFLTFHICTLIEGGGGIVRLNRIRPRVSSEFFSPNCSFGLRLCSVSQQREVER